MFVVRKTHKSVVNKKFSFTITHRELSNFGQCLCALNVAMRYSPKRWQQNTCSKNRGQQNTEKSMKRADKRLLVLVLTGESVSMLTETEIVQFFLIIKIQNDFCSNAFYCGKTFW